jgi:hypothetical protein
MKFFDLLRWSWADQAKAGHLVTCDRYGEMQLRNTIH